MSTIFSKIIAREIPAHIVYEDDQVLAFLDNQPVHLGHTLVIPKMEHINVFDLPPELFAHMASIGQKVAHAVRDITDADGVNLYMNNGEAAGQEVFHAHLHVVPRFLNDKSYTAPVRDPRTDSATVTQFATDLAEKLT